MVRENRIKEYRFSKSAVSAATTTYSDYPINGEILQIESSFDQNGSLALTTSGTSQEFWRKNASSGANYIFSFPRIFSESTTGSIANASHIPFVVHDPIGLTMGSTAAGTLNVTVKYR